jgi:PAS domain S-box-containing protein
MFELKNSSVSLASRLTLALNGVVVVVTLLAGGWFYFDATHKAKERIEAKSRQVGIYLQGALNLPLWEMDDQAVKAIGQTLMEDRTLNAVTIQDSDSNIIYTKSRENDPVALTHLISIEHEGDVIGSVQVSFSVEALREQTNKLLLVNVTIVLAVLLAISLSTVFLINRLLRRPIEQLTIVAKSFGQGSPVGPHVMTKSYREFQPLLNVLTEMEEQINRQISKLTKSEERFRQVAMTNWVWETDSDGRYTYCSENVIDTLGYSSQEMLGKTPFDFMRDDEVVRIKGFFAEAVADKKQIIDLENWNITKDGAEICLLTNGVPFFGKEGNLIGYRGADKDITDRKLAEKELAKHREQLEHLVAERTLQLKEAQDGLIQGERLATLGRLTATVSHELRNPLGTIQTALCSISASLGQSETHQTERSLELAERSINRCVNIIEELTDYTRVKKLNLSKTTIDEWLKTLLDEQIFPEEINCELDLSCGVRAPIDQERLRQVIVNLVTNAEHALMDERSSGKLLQVSTRLCGSEYDVCVCDNGIGMSDKTVKKIFEPLYSTKGFGVGLGMVISKTIVEQHHGKISIKSKEEEGTTVCLRLPLSLPEERKPNL